MNKDAFDATTPPNVTLGADDSCFFEVGSMAIVGSMPHKSTVRDTHSAGIYTYIPELGHSNGCRFHPRRRGYSHYKNLHIYQYSVCDLT